MDADKLIQAFIQVVQNQDYVFSPEAIDDIPSLQKTLAELKTVSTESLAEVLRLWYINHESVRDAVLIEEREISKVKKANPSSQENTQENRLPVLQEELRKLQDKKQK
ncbi:hypothetical protein G7B40_020120 [Aetokthonos hydrillicola Thurmond2011]|jgi:predicted RND superfamily exporter protein|uniref:Uncharacterized protein n=1 Tax=Aetokthonos hydrillicola Thurmond2011 TaxID=2712845 RepID=A0AAP5MBH0_9CYAN|nr:hypothetical protein [Aetokthonos hydrillicola]MBO3464181.1 hypothetical protein [Aetokthonos hydrillicola CCALA 1050]MBW4588526.1 hypothetical protein [Aetokthonos hydrillicola CCALA 1050]MDR9896854.1 hypothetical protein [Aetokthonos hydrillicola Thurmond2011]